MEFRRELAMPLMLLGGINRLDTMQQAMADGFDFVVMGGRALLREPDLVNRLQAGGRPEGDLHPLQPVHADDLLGGDAVSGVGGGGRSSRWCGGGE